MILRNVTIYGKEGKKNILISRGIIESIADAAKDIPAEKDEPVYNLEETVAFPGFINSHDHLDFNLYPQLGNRIYKNYTEWGKDIHETNKDIIEAVKKVPEPLRIQWGLYKNLLNGFTAVVNHGKRLNTGNDLVNVFQECYSLHSVAFENYWRLKLNNPFSGRKPYVIHAGEGTDEKAKKEIDRLIDANWFRNKLIAVHGIAMNEQQASSFIGLVWCPASNYFLMGETAAVNKLKHKTTIAFGTDSTLTASWNAKDHFKAALISGMLNEKELVDMLTIVPASLWGLDKPGEIKEGQSADLQVRSGNSLVDSEVKMVIKNGQLLLADESLLLAGRSASLNNFSRIKLNGRVLIVKGDIKNLIKEILKYFPSAFIPFEVL